MLYQALIRIRLDEPDPDAARKAAEQFCERIDNESCTDVTSIVAITAEPDVEPEPWPGEESFGSNDGSGVPL